MLASGPESPHGVIHAAHGLLHSAAWQPPGASRSCTGEPAAAAQHARGRGRRHHQAAPAAAAGLSGKVGARTHGMRRRHAGLGERDRARRPARMGSAPPHQPRDEHHGEHQRQSSEQDTTDDAHAADSIASGTSAFAVLTFFCLRCSPGVSWRRVNRSETAKARTCAAYRLSQEPPLDEERAAKRRGERWFPASRRRGFAGGLHYLHGNVGVLRVHSKSQEHFLNSLVKPIRRPVDCCLSYVCFPCIRNRKLAYDWC